MVLSAEHKPKNFGPIPAQKVIHKEMVSGKMLMGRSCSSFQSQAQLLQGLQRAWPLVWSAFVNNLCLLLLSAAKTNFTGVQRTQTSQRRSLPWVRGEGCPHTEVMAPDPSSALCPVPPMLSKKLIMVKTHISASPLIPFASPHHLSWVG